MAEREKLVAKIKRDRKLQAFKNRVATQTTKLNKAQELADNELNADYIERHEKWLTNNELQVEITDPDELDEERRIQQMLRRERERVQKEKEDEEARLLSEKLARKDMTLIDYYQKRILTKTYREKQNSTFDDQNTNKAQRAGKDMPFRPKPL